MLNITSKYFRSDLRASLVVFLVALPLCLGIALASGAPLFAGIVSGVVGGIVVGLLSNSQLSVSGPAAGLTAITLAGIADLGSFEVFLMAGVLAGALQLVLGYVKAGVVSNYLPSNVIEGMLAAIGIIIILSQVPHAVGYDAVHEGDYFHIDKEGRHHLFSTVIDAVNFMHAGALIVALASLAVLIAFERVALLKKIKAVPSALVAVLVGVGINGLFKIWESPLEIKSAHLVNLPVASSISDLWSQFTLPDFTQIANGEVWVVAITITAVASIETLLCIEAADKIDPLKRFTNTNTELKAQGVGNILSCVIGGIPMTSVIVRSSVNVNSGGRTKLSAVFHGVLLLMAVALIPHVLNKIPLASLAAILIMVGYNLANPQIFRHMWEKSKKFQFIPFIVTMVAVIVTDLLIGVGIGMVVSVYFILRGNVKLAYFFKREAHAEGEIIRMELAQEVSFLNKAAIRQTFVHLPENSRLVIDASHTIYIDHDVLQMIRDFVDITSKERNIHVDLVGFRKAYDMVNSQTHVTSQLPNVDGTISPMAMENEPKIPSNYLNINDLK